MRDVQCERCEIVPVVVRFYLISYKCFCILNSPVCPWTLVKIHPWNKNFNCLFHRKCYANDPYWGVGVSKYFKTNTISGRSILAWDIDGQVQNGSDPKNGGGSSCFAEMKWMDTTCLLDKKNDALQSFEKSIGSHLSPQSIQVSIPPCRRRRAGPP